MTLQGGDLVLPGGMTLDPSAALLPDAALTLQALQALPGADSPALQQQVLQLSQQVTPEQLQQVPPLVAQLVGSALAAGQLAAQQGLEVLVQAQSKAEQLESRVQQLEREKDELKRDNQQLRGSFADAMVAGKQEEEGQQAGGPQQVSVGVSNDQLDTTLWQGLLWRCCSADFRQRDAICRPRRRLSDIGCIGLLAEGNSTLYRGSICPNCPHAHPCRADHIMACVCMRQATFFPVVRPTHSSSFCLIITSHTSILTPITSHSPFPSHIPRASNFSHTSNLTHFHTVHTIHILHTQAAATDQQGGSTEVAELWQLVLSQQATILQQQQALAALQALLQQLQALGRQENATIAQQAEALKEFEGLLLRIVEAYQQELARRQQQQ